MPSLSSVRKAHSRKRRWHIVQSLFFIFIFALAVFVFFQSPFFMVKEIRITGVKQLGREEVKGLAGLAEGVNIFKADLKQAEGKVALHPMVKKVEMSRDLPDSVIINITERQPVGLIPGQPGYTVIGDDGRCLSVIKNLSTINLPFITGITVKSAVSGQPVSDNKLNAALAYLSAMPDSLKAAVSEINVADLNDIRMFTIDTVEVKFGDDRRIEEKIKLYKEVISQKYRDRIQYIDVSYQGNPVIKFIQQPHDEKQQ